MIATALLLMAVWVALARSLSPLTIAVGFVVAMTVLLAQRLLFPERFGAARRLLRHPVQLLTFLGILCVRLVQSTLHTCRVILFAREDGRLVALPSRARDPLAQLLLSHAITLTPSTISLLIDGDHHYVHWLQARGDKGDWTSIKESLERRLIRLLERTA